MGENKELVSYLVEGNSSKWEAIVRFNRACNIGLLVCVLLIGFYIFTNLEAFKTLGHDVCALCMNKTGAVCYIAPNNLVPKPVNISTLLSNMT